MGILIWISLAVLVVAIAVGSLASGMTSWPPGISPGLSHLLAYTAMGGLAAAALEERQHGVWMALGLTVLVGTTLEFAQMLVAVRTFTWFDLGMNVLGAVIGVTGAVLGSRWLGKR